MPSSYYCSLNEFGKRLDSDRRPELRLGAYDIKAPSVFTIREATKQQIVVLFDVSLPAYQTGFLYQTIESVKSCLESLLQPEKTSICFATYHSTINYFIIPKRDGEPGQAVEGEEHAEGQELEMVEADYTDVDPSLIQVGDIDDPFIPLPADKLFINVGKEPNRLYALLEKIETFYSAEHYQGGRQQTKISIGAAAKSGMIMCEKFGGRVMIFGCCLSSMGLGRV